MVMDRQPHGRDDVAGRLHDVARRDGGQDSVSTIPVLPWLPLANGEPKLQDGPGQDRRAGAPGDAGAAALEV